MITVELFLALITFYFVMFFTPGPNNIMLAISGIKFGFIKTIPHMIGIPLGHVTQIALVACGLGKFFQTYPEIQNILKFVGCAYLLFLAYKMFGSLNVSDQNNASGKPMKIYEAVLFQYLNPKAWVASITATTVFFPNEESFIKGVLFLTLSAPLLEIFAVTTWAGFGSAIRLYISNIKIKKIIEIIMSALLVLTAVNILL
jgi:threonine/homoserine/homoserine lactone efflux protein